MEQVIFTDTIEVDSELPEGQTTFIKHLAAMAKSAKLKVARLCSSGTIEETFLRSKDADADTCVNEGVVLEDHFAAETAEHILEAKARISRPCISTKCSKKILRWSKVKWDTQMALSKTD